MLLPKLEFSYNAEYFRAEEFICPCCGQGRAEDILVFWLDVLRRAWGGAIRVNSGFRCPSHNKKVGGSSKSRHLRGCAADISPVMTEQGLEAAAGRRAFFELALRLCSKPGWEALVYARHIHIAIPTSAGV